MSDGNGLVRDDGWKKFDRRFRILEQKTVKCGQSSFNWGTSTLPWEVLFCHYLNKKKLFLFICICVFYLKKVIIDLTTCRSQYNIHQHKVMTSDLLNAIIVNMFLVYKLYNNWHNDIHLNLKFFLSLWWSLQRWTTLKQKY